ncbi:MAG: YdeI/OmpD-associated family protein [Saprospiraceae bacterium]
MDYDFNPEIDNYLSEGCGRCPLGGTPDCKVHKWTKELEMLRLIALECGLKEELKWKVPTYTFQNNNVAVVSALNDYAVLSFFKGSLLQDEHQILQKPGPNTQSARIIPFTDTKRIEELKTILKTYLFEAIEVEKEGLKVDFKAKNELEYPEELIQKMENDPELKEAFEALTPGRQRGYVLYFNGAKQSKTKLDRINKYRSKILTGLGVHER